LVEHLFVAELLKISWQAGECSLEIAKPEVDNRGYDLIVERAGVVRHVQLKTSHLGAGAASQKVHLALREKPSGCVVWIKFDETSLVLGPFLFYGGGPGEPLPEIAQFKVAKHVKANMQGIKAERPGLRIVPKSKFKHIASIQELFQELFGPGSGH